MNAQTHNTLLYIATNDRRYFWTALDAYERRQKKLVAIGFGIMAILAALAIAFCNSPITPAVAGIQ